MAKMQSVRVPQKLPVILNKEEVTRLLGCVSHIKHQTALSLAYGTGLRVSEVVALKVTDIDSQRMTADEFMRRFLLHVLPGGLP
jgi:integrase